MIHIFLFLIIMPIVIIPESIVDFLPTNKLATISNNRLFYLELYLYLDKNYTETYGSNAVHTIEIFRYLRAIMKLVNIQTKIKYIEQGSQDPVLNSVDIPSRYLSRKRLNIKLNYDFFLALSTLAIDNGMSVSLNGMCSFRSSFGLVSTIIGRQPMEVAMMIAKVLAVTLGVTNDDGSTCTGGSKYCIMDFNFGNAQMSSRVGPIWSTASQNAFVSSFETFYASCLRNEVTLGSDPLDGIFCGNGIVEAGEQCDPGRLALDSTSSGACCTNQCKFASGATCASGICCNTTTCKPKNKNTICRAAVDECDIDETCDGVSETCSVDMYKSNGISCDNERGSCYDGQCGSTTAQCKAVFGSTATPAQETCNNYLNSQSSLSLGYCNYQVQNLTNQGFDYLEYRCDNDDFHCGALQCESLPAGNLFNFSDSSKSCNNVYHVFFDSTFTKQRDPGLVRNGALCNDNKICFNSLCSTRPIPCSCSNNGFCDNLGICHCNTCYSGTLCDFNYCKSTLPTTTDENGKDIGLPVIIGVSIGGAVLLVVVIILLVVLIKKKCCKEETNSSGEEKNRESVTYDVNPYKLEGELIYSTIGDETFADADA